MTSVTAAELIRQARTSAGLTQSEFAQRAGITQSVVSAYETGKREPAFSTLRRLVAAAGCSLEAHVAPTPRHRLLDRVRAHADELREQLTPLGAVDIRVFGSVARGEETPTSDVDLLVDFADEVGLFAVLQMQSAAEAILGRPGDIVPASGLKPDTVDRVMREAVPL